MEETPRPSAPITARDLFRVLRRRLPLFLFTFAIVVAGTFYFTSKMPSVYEAKTRVLMENPIAGSAPTSIMDLMTGGGARTLDTEMEKIKARPFLEKIARVNQIPTDDMDALRNHITITSGPGGSILDIAAKAETAAKAQKLANTVADEYISMARSEYRQRANVSHQRLEEAQKSALEEKKQADLNLKAFTDRAGVSRPEILYNVKAQAAVSARNDLENARKNLPLQIANLTTQQAQLARIPSELMTGYTLNKNPVIDEYRTQIVNLETDRKKKLLDFAPDSDEVLAIDNEIRARRGAIAEAEKNLFSAGSRGISRNPDYSQLQSQITQGVLSILQTRNNIAFGERRLTEIEAEQKRLTSQQTLYENLLAKRQAATAAFEQARAGLLKMDMTRILSAPYISILENAELPKKPISPKPWLNALMALTLGLMLGMGMALLAEYLASGSITEEELPELPRLGGAPLLGILPIALPPPANSESNGLPAPLQTSSGAEDALREIGFTLARRHARDPVTVALFSGARTDDFSAALTARLAATLVRDGLRVTLIDADRQHPRLNRIFGAPDAPGLADLLRSNGSRRATDILHVGANGALRFLAAGSPDDPAEATEANLRRVFKELSDPRETDIVLVSGPSVWQVGLIAPLERAASGMTIVVPDNARGLSPADIVTRARHLLTNGYRPRILGVVVGLESTQPDIDTDTVALTDGKEDQIAVKDSLRGPSAAMKGASGSQKIELQEDQDQR